MGTSIKLHNKTVDKTASILSPDNQTVDLEFKLPNKGGTIATTDDVNAGAVNEQQVVEIINKTVVENKETVEKVSSSLGETKIENMGKEVDGIYTQFTSAKGKSPFLKPLDRALYWSVGEGPAVKGADAHYATLKEALQEAAYYRKIPMANVKTEWSYTNNTNKDVTYTGDASGKIIKPGETFKKEMNLPSDNIYPTWPGAEPQNSSITGDFGAWRDDFNIAKKHTNTVALYIVLKEGYVDKDFHEYEYGVDLRHVIVMSQDGKCKLDNKAIADKWQLATGGRGFTWMSFDDSIAPQFASIEFIGSIKYGSYKGTTPYDGSKDAEAVAAIYLPDCSFHAFKFFRSRGVFSSCTFTNCMGVFSLNYSTLEAYACTFNKGSGTCSAHNNSYFYSSSSIFRDQMFYLTTHSSYMFLEWCTFELTDPEWFIKNDYFRDQIQIFRMMYDGHAGINQCTFNNYENMIPEASYFLFYGVYRASTSYWVSHPTLNNTKHYRNGSENIRTDGFAGTGEYGTAPYNPWGVNYSNEFKFIQTSY